MNFVKYMEIFNSVFGIVSRSLCIAQTFPLLCYRHSICTAGRLSAVTAVLLRVVVLHIQSVLLGLQLRQSWRSACVYVQVTTMLGTQRVKVAHPCLWVFIRHLKDAQTLNKNTADAARRGSPAPRPCRKWRRLHNHIRRMTARYSSGAVSLNRWRAISYLVGAKLWRRPLWHKLTTVHVVVVGLAFDNNYVAVSTVVVCITLKQHT